MQHLFSTKQVYQPFTVKSKLFNDPMTKFFEKVTSKEENTGNQHFLLFIPSKIIHIIKAASNLLSPCSKCFQFRSA